MQRSAEEVAALASFDMVADAEFKTGCRGVASGEYVKYRDCPKLQHHDCFYIRPNTEDGYPIYECKSDCTLCERKKGSAVDYLIDFEGLTVHEAMRRLSMPDSEGHGMSEASKMCYDRHGILLRLEQKGFAEYELNDQDIAGHIAAIFGDKVRYVPEDDSFYVYDGVKWARDPKGSVVMGYITDFAGILTLYVRANIWKDNTRKNGAAVRKAEQYKNRTRRDAVMKDIRDKLSTPKKEFDTDLMRFNVRNKTLHFVQDGEYGTYTVVVDNHSAEDMISQVADVDYPEKRDTDEFELACALWMVTVERILPNPEHRSYLQKLMGLSLIGDTSLERFHIAGRERRAGKGTLLNSIAAMFGTDPQGYAKCVMPSVFQERSRDSSKASPDLAELHKKRFILASEPSENMTLDAGLMKQYTGNDSLTVRRLYKEEFSFTACGNVIMMTNWWPHVNDPTIFTSDRVVIIPFEQHFGPEDRIDGLKSQLSTDVVKSVILLWCIEGLKLYGAEGLEPTPEMLKLTAEYHEKSDSLERYFKEELVKAPDINLKAAEVYDRYKEWKESEGYKGCENKNTFYDRLRARGCFKETARINGTPERSVIVGYGFRGRF